MKERPQLNVRKDKGDISFSSVPIVILIGIWLLIFLNLIYDTITR